MSSFVSSIGVMMKTEVWEESGMTSRLFFGFFNFAVLIFDF